MTQIQIPSGMRDLFPQECLVKQELKKRIFSVFRSYGYEEIETPLIEYYSTYQNTFTELREEELYKFIDETGQILALRTDMTLPIARVCATKFGNAKPPFRFSYCSNVYKVRQSFAGKRNEVTDCGIELIGLDKNSDLEVLCCAMDVMESLGVADYTLEIGNSDFFKKACSAAGIRGEDVQKIAGLADRKAMTDLKVTLAEMNLPGNVRTFFETLPLLAGKNALEEALSVCFTDSLMNEIESMMELRSQLRELGYEQHLTFDLGKVPHLDYYTGIIFEGFAAGIGTGILSGGRYDALLKKVGRDLPAIGFGVKLDYLTDSVEVRKPAVKKLYYPKDRIVEAIRKAKTMRRECAVELIPWEKDEMEVAE